MYHKAFINCYFILFVCFQVGQLNGEATEKAEDPKVRKSKPVLVSVTTTAAPEKLFDSGYPMNSMYPYSIPRGYGNYYPSNSQYYPNNPNNNAMGWPNNPQGYPNQGNYPNGPYSNYPNNQGNGYNRYPSQPIYTNQPYDPTLQNGPGYQAGPGYNNRPPYQGGMNDGSQNGYNNNQQNPNNQPSYPNGPNSYPGNYYPNNQGRPNQNNFPNQPGPNGINAGSPRQPSYPNNNNNNGPQNSVNRPHSNQEVPMQGEGSNSDQPIRYPVQDSPKQNDQSNITTDSGDNVPNDTGIDDVAAILGKPVTVPQDTTPSSNIKFPNATESASKKQCVQDCHATTEYDPVCGTDNVTYVNPGKLVCARNCGLRVYVSQNGKCKDDL